MDGGRIVAIMSWAAAWRIRTTNATQKKNKGSAVIPDGKIYVLSEPKPSFQIESVADSLLYAQIKAVVFLIYKLNYEQLSLNLILQRILQVHLARIPMLANDCRSQFWRMDSIQTRTCLIFTGRRLAPWGFLKSSTYASLGAQINDSIYEGESISQHGDSSMMANSRI